MRTTRSGPTVAALLLSLLVALPAHAQERSGGPGPMGMMQPDPLEVVLEHRAELGITDAQGERLARFHGESLERSAAAREMVDAMRRRMAEEGRRGRMGQPDQMGRRGEAGERDRAGARGRMGPRDERGGPDRMDPEMREAMETLRSERQRAMAELRETLSPEQFQQLRTMLEARRPGPRPGG